jgi:hypothetical protein
MPSNGNAQRGVLSYNDSMNFSTNEDFAPDVIAPQF